MEETWPYYNSGPKQNIPEMYIHQSSWPIDLHSNVFNYNEWRTSHFCGSSRPFWCRVGCQILWDRIVSIIKDICVVRRKLLFAYKPLCRIALRHCRDRCPSTDSGAPNTHDAEIHDKTKRNHSNPSGNIPSVCIESKGQGQSSSSSCGSWNSDNWSP